MEFIPKNPLLDFPPDLLQQVRNVYNLDQPGRMAEAVDILEEWIKKQEHFTKNDFSRSYLESTIISSKGSLERAKSRIDKLCTYKTILPKLFEICNVKEELASFMDILCFTALPQLTKDYYRVLIVKTRRTDFKSSDFIKFINIICLFLEYEKQYDYAIGYILVFNNTEISFTDLIPKLGLNELQQLVTVGCDGYGARVKAVIFITASKLIDGFVKFVKQFVSEKIGNRIQVCKTLEELYEFVPRAILPLDYGGTARTSQEIHDEWINLMSSEENVNFFEVMRNARTNEELRTPDTFNEQYMGMPGTFRSLNVD